MSDALEHVRYSCGIAGEEVANYVDQLQARVAELEAEREGIKQALISDYYFSGLPIAYSVGELVAGYKDRNKSAHVFMQQLNETEKQNAELKAEVERLKRTNSSYANLTKAQESQLTNLRQRLYQLKGVDSAIDSERQANCDLTEQLAAEQLNNKLLRKALEAVIKVHGYESGIPVEALAQPSDTFALDAYVAEKVKEAVKEADDQILAAKNLLAIMHRDGGHHEFAVGFDQAIQDAMAVYYELTKRRELALDALRSCGVNDGLNGPTQYFDEELVGRAIKGSIE